jgi:protein-S-isoprenylcysteine O-methyltransferase Ste14
MVYIGLPTLLALAVTLCPPAQSPHGMAFKATTIGLLIAAVLVREGVICLIIVAPLVYFVVHGLVAIFQAFGRRTYALAPIVTAIRYASLLVPLAALLVAAGIARPDRRTRGGALFGFITAALGLAALNTVAGHVGWWSFARVDGTALGVPADLWVGWSVLWGALPVLLPRVRVVILLPVLAWLDVVAMPHLAPVVRLGPSWLVGEAVGLIGVALPAILVGRWTATARHLTARVVLQFGTVAVLLLWFGPSLAIASGDGSWHHVLAAQRWAQSVLVQLAVLAGLPGVLAVREFAERGGGTPYPWDPPRRLVTTGPYAYVANPMQLSGTALLLVMAAATRSWSMVAAAGFAVGFSAAVAGPHEEDDLTRRHGAAWSAYRSQVRAWWPRWRPAAPPAEVYLARTCGVCSSTAGELGRLAPVRLRIRPAEAYTAQDRGQAAGLAGARSSRPLDPQVLRRARYQGHDGYQADGVAALARALEHVNLGWAAFGWCLRLPLLDRVVQSIVDSLGGGPREIRRSDDGHAVQAP